MQREKEESADYRYFPDPDLVSVAISTQQIEEARTQLGELPQAKRQRFEVEYELKAYDAEVLVSQGRGVADYFETLVRLGGSPKRASAWMQQDVLRTLKERAIAIEAFPFGAEKMATLLQAIEDGKLDTTRAREVFQFLLTQPTKNIADSISELGIAQVDSKELEQLCRDLLQANPEVIERVRAGNVKAIASLIGQAKKKNANADPRQVQEICLRMIAESS